MFCALVGETSHLPFVFTFNGEITLALRCILARMSMNDSSGMRKLQFLHPMCGGDHQHRWNSITQNLNICLTVSLDTKR